MTSTRTTGTRPTSSSCSGPARAGSTVATRSSRPPRAASRISIPAPSATPTTARLWKRNLALPDGATKTRAWTELDDHLVDEAAWLPVANEINVVFLTKRVGNYGYQPAVGGSLWDRLTVR